MVLQLQSQAFNGIIHILMTQLSIENIQMYRANTYRLNTGQQLTNLQAAAGFVKDRGFIYFWPIKGVNFPSLWTAVAGSRPVANAHDDPGHVTWGWKDDSLGQRIWYYAKVLRKRATMIDLAVAPYFYALSENYGNPEEDVRIQYHEGHLTQEAKAVFEVIQENGPMDTIAIRRATRMTSKDSNSRFERAISLLQTDFKVLPVGISDSGGWRYAFIYELVHRYYPTLSQAARLISETEAHRTLTRLFFLSLGAAQLRDVTRLFQWSKGAAEGAIHDLVESGFLIAGLDHPEISGEWFALQQVL